MTLGRYPLGTSICVDKTAGKLSSCREPGLVPRFTLFDFSSLSLFRRVGEGVDGSSQPGFLVEKRRVSKNEKSRGGGCRTWAGVRNKKGAKEMGYGEEEI